MVPRKTSESEDFVDSEGAPAQLDTPVPRWLMAVYVVVPLVGIAMWCFFWNGSGGADGIFDRGAWTQLQRAAKTTYPWKITTDKDALVE